MRGRFGFRTIALAALLLAAPVLAGCTGSASGSTAKAQQSTADSQAQSWSSQAELVGIFGFEGTTELPDDSSSGPSPDEQMCEGDYIQDAEDDGDVGDGEAAFWVYLYRAADRDMDHVVVVGGDGGTIAECDVPAESEMSPIGSYDLDSDEAADIARDENSDISDASGLVMMLGNSDDNPNPVWIVVSPGDGSGGAGAFVAIDAVTGEVMFNSEDFGGMGGGG